MLNKAYNGTYYGGYRTRTFADIFPSVNEFKEELSKIPLDISEVNLDTLYYLLYARYGNSNTSYSDETQFKFAVCSTIFQYGPTWAKRLEVQKALRGLSESDLVTGAKAIYNHSFNPSTQPSTSTLEELTTINDQNTTNHKKSKMEAYSLLLELLKTDVTGEFINKFNKLFIQVLAPDYPLLYETFTED